MVQGAGLMYRECCEDELEKGFIANLNLYLNDLRRYFSLSCSSEQPRREFQ